MGEMLMVARCEDPVARVNYPGRLELLLDRENIFGDQRLQSVKRPPIPAEQGLVHADHEVALKCRVELADH
jgi:hypothetical protein